MTREEALHLKKQVTATTPILGKWIAGRALEKLLTADSIDAMRVLEEILRDDNCAHWHDEIAGRLLMLPNQKQRDALGAVWVETRSKKLESLLAQAEWEVQPTGTRVMVQLLRTRGSRFEDTGTAQVKWLIEAVSDPDPQLSETAAKALRELKNPTAIEYLCSEWARTRRPELEAAVLSGGYVISTPGPLKILISLLIGSTASLNAHDVPLVCGALEDASAAVRKNAETWLRGLQHDDQKEKLCQWVLDNSSSVVEEIARSLRLSPARRNLKALFYFVTGQKREYEEVDFDGSLLAALYRVSEPPIRTRIATAARAYGAGEWVRLLSANHQDWHLQLADADWATTVEVLAAQQNFPELWRIFNYAPAKWAAQILFHLENRWTPSDELAARHCAACLKILSPLREQILAGDWLPGCAIAHLPVQMETLPVAGSLTSFRLIPQTNLAAFTSENRLLLSDLAGRKTTWTSEPHTDWISCVSIAPNGSFIATGGADRAVCLHDWRSAKVIHKWRGHAGEVRDIFFAPDGKTIFSAGEDGRVRKWHRESAEGLAVMQGTSAVVKIEEHPSHKQVAVAYLEGSIRLWDLVTGEPGRLLSGHQKPAVWLRFSSDGRFLYSGGKDRSVIIWDLENGSLKTRLKQHKDDVSCGELSPDGRLLATGSWDNTVCLWNASTGECLDVLGSTGTNDGHSGWITGLRYSEDGQWLFSSSFDGTVRVWDLATRRQAAVLEGHEKAVIGFQIRDQGASILTAGADGTLRSWASGLLQVLETPAAKYTVDQMNWAFDLLAHKRGLTAVQQAWLHYALLRIRWTKRHDISVDQKAEVTPGEFDIEILG